ncbi:MAG: 3-oxoacyl-ACP reductase [Coxiella sp. RIFCSPHIGHO2_12_FULL_42_15]|nr:MAG: 3-oxoacyl-ACP reductase [Coxiella sp. RIFCSPHIGHO2_12_FULL_42_15]
MKTSFATYPSLKNRGVFITGGTTGIGASLVEHFCQQGARVAFVGRNQTAASTLIQNIQSAGHTPPLFLPCDLKKIKEIQSAIKYACQKLEDIRVLINNAADDTRHNTAEVTESFWNESCDINLRHQFFTAQALIPQMITNGGGSIINFSSNCFLLSRMSVYPCYSTFKAGIIGLTRALACEFGMHRIRVNCILPGWVMTERQIEKWLTPEAEKELLQEQALKQKIYPEDVARMALFLAADDSALITKQSFIVDGGRV